jgi:hypothetical protein
MVGLLPIGVWVANQFGDRRANKNRRQREEALAPRIQANSQSLLDGYRTMPDFSSVNPQVAVPDYGRIRDGVAGGYGSARDQLAGGFNQFTEGLRGAYGSRASGLGQMRSELGAMFNFGEDPYARALLNFTQGDIDARRLAAVTGTDTTFADAVAAIDARKGNIDPAAAAAATQFIYEQAAAQAAATNASNAEAIAPSAQSVVGIGPASGEAADIAQAIAASGGVAADGARGDAEIVRSTLDFLAANTTSAGAARRGELENLAVAAQAAATKRFMEQEQARIAAERDQYRQLEIGLRNQELMLDSELQERLAGAGWDNNQAISGLTLREMEALTGLDLSQEDARVAAENLFARDIGQRNMDWLDQTAGPDPVNMVRAGMESNAGTWNSFKSYINQVLMGQDPLALVALSSLGITNEETAKSFWEDNYKNLGSSESSSSVGSGWGGLKLPAGVGPIVDITRRIIGK